MSRPESSYMIIGLAGRAGAGKDTCADILCKAHRFFRTAFADPLRVEIVHAFGIDPGMFSRDLKTRKDHALAIGRCNSQEFITLMAGRQVDIAAPRSPREIMQWWGTEYRRNQSVDYWVERTGEAIDVALRSGHRRVVITDVRYANEAGFVRDIGGSIWRVRRTLADTTKTAHSSEIALESITPNLIIDNDSSFVSLTSKTLRAFNACCNAE